MQKSNQCFVGTLVSGGRLEEKVFPLSEEIAGYETKNQAAKVGLPCYEWEEGEYEETSDYR